MASLKTIINSILTEKYKQRVTGLFWSLLLVTLLVRFVPFSPRMPSSGLDPSWRYALNEAVAKKLPFGQGVVFTMGPYASVYTREYHPATDSLMVIAAILLTLGYWLSLILVSRQVPWYFVLAFTWIIFGTRYSPDTILLSIPLIVALAGFKTASPGPSDNRETVWLASLYAILGLLPLIKGSLLLMCLLAVLAGTVWQLLTHHRRRAFILMAITPISMVLFWIAAGQPLTALPLYLKGISWISEGYSEAMSAPGRNLEVHMFLGAAGIILLSASSPGIRRQPVRNLLITSLLLLFLFISFKAGFVRHDSHALVCSSSILTAGLILLFLRRTILYIPAIVATVAAWYVIESGHPGSGSGHFFNNLGNSYAKTWNGFVRRTHEPGLKGEYRKTVDSIRVASGLPAIKGTSDIYTANQAVLIATGGTWSPRPVFQSYAAYTPELAGLNRQHLLGSGAPDWVIVDPAPIDGRLPLMEDGPSWPILFTRYRPVGTGTPWLVLERIPGLAGDGVGEIIASTHQTIGQSFDTPAGVDPIIISLDILPTFAGKLAAIAFKPVPLSLIIELADGSHRTFRIVSGMTKTGFMLSPLLETPAEIRMFFENPLNLGNKSVRSVRVEPQSKSIFPHWQNGFRVTIRRMTAPPSQGTTPGTP